MFDRIHLGVADTTPPRSRNKTQHILLICAFFAVAFPVSLLWAKQTLRAISNIANFPCLSNYTEMFNRLVSCRNRASICTVGWCHQTVETLNVTKSIRCTNSSKHTNSSNLQKYKLFDTNDRRGSKI